jgi:hypothetical protein
MDFTPVLIKMHEDAVLSLQTYTLEGFPDAGEKEMLDSWMRREDFQKAAQKLMDTIYPHTCDLFMWELKKVVDAKIEERKQELIKLGVKDDRTL